jgi:hypothetical protein
VAAADVLLVEPVEAAQFEDVSVEVVEVVLDFAVDDFAPAVFDAPDVVAVGAVVVPAAMQAPSTAVATTLAAPAATRERAAGRRRDRFRLGCIGCSLMAPIIRIGGKGPAKQL